MRQIKAKLLVALFFLCLISTSGHSTPLHFSAALSTLALSVGIVFKDRILCYLSECCDKPWVHFNHSAFQVALQRRVYGQPLIGRLSQAIQDHWNNRQPTKALVVTLHGPTGTGKNYAVRILTDHLYKLGSRSKFYHFFSATVHFPHARLFDAYADQLHQWVRGNVSICPKSVFVFDEIDKMPHALLDVLKPFVDYHDQLNGIDYRSSIFIFLSNSGSDLIMRKMVQLIRSGRSRSDADTAAYFDHLLSEHVFTDNSSALRDSALLKHHLVSRFVPFLPLEREHVIGCINDYVRTSHPAWRGSQKLIDRVLAELPFVPEGEQFFSSAGCKRIVDKTLMVLTEIS